MIRMARRRRDRSPGRPWRPPLLMAHDCSPVPGPSSWFLACQAYPLSVWVVFLALGCARFARFGGQAHRRDHGSLI